MNKTMTRWYYGTVMAMAFLIGGCFRAFCNANYMSLDTVEMWCYFFGLIVLMDLILMVIFESIVYIKNLRTARINGNMP